MTGPAESSAQPATDDRATWALIVGTSLVVLFVVLTPFSAFLGRTALERCLAADTALTVLVAIAMVARPRLGCAALFVPFVSTLTVAAAAAADRGYVGPVHLVVHGLALVVIVAGWMLRGDRGPRPRSPRG